MRGSFRVARVNGIDIRVHFTFLLVLGWVALDWGAVRGQGPMGALYGVIFVGLLFLCVTLHELGHSLVAQRQGAVVRGITLLPIGGVAQLEGEPERPIQELWMAVAGPAVNVALAVIIGAFTLPLLGWRVLEGWGLLIGRLNGLSLERLLVELMVANVGLAIFNLLPAFPMDGGRVLRSLLALRIDEVQATHIAARVGQGLAVLFGLVGLFTGAFNLLLIAGFIFFGAEQEWRGKQVTAALRQVPAQAALLHGTRLSPQDPLSRAIDLSLRTGQTDFAIFDGGYLVGVLTRSDVVNRFHAHGPNVPVGRVMRTDFPVAQANESLIDLYRKMRQSGSSVISVVDDGRFLGLATAESVRRAMRRPRTGEWRVVGR